MEKILGYLSGQGEAQSKNRHPFNQVRAPAQIGSDDGLPDPGLDFDNRYGNFCMG
jgi:hypothetical protein